MAYVDRKSYFDEYRKQQHVKDRKRDFFTRTRYGLELGQEEMLYLAQCGKCSICEKDDAPLVVDHDHRTKTFRGLLCRQCNSALGVFGDSVEGLQRAIDYLESIK